MKKFSYSPLALAIVTGIIATPVLADTPAPKIDEVIVVTASGMEQKVVDAPASISVISNEDLAQKNYHDLAEALSGVEGVDIRSGTGKTGGLDISIRGMPSNYTLVLVDGVRQSASSDTTPNGFGSMNTGFMPPLNAIDHIEVIRGPMSTLYGSDAIGGVVNIITKKYADQWGGSLNIAHAVQEDDKWGDSSTVGFYAAGPLIKDSLNLTLRGNMRHRQGTSMESLSETSATRTPFPTESDNYTVGGRLNYKLNDQHHLWLDAEVAQQQFDNANDQLGPVGTAGGGYESQLQYEQAKLVLGYDAELSFATWKSDLLYSTTENKGRLITARSLPIEFAPIDGEKRELKNRNIILNSKLIAAIGDAHQLTAGFEYWNAQMKDGIVLAVSGETFEQDSYSVYAEDQWMPLEPLTVTLGARYEKHDDFNGHVSPRAYAVYTLADDWTVKGGVSTGYNTPALSQLHDGVSGVTGQGSINTVGNPSLNPEKSTNYEAGVYYENIHDFNANITVFYNKYEDAIESYAVNDDTNSYRNVGKAKVEGVEFATSFPVLIDALNFNLNYTYNHSEQLNGDNAGAPLNATAKHMLNARLQWQVNDDLTARISAEYHGKLPRYTSVYDNLTATQQQVVTGLGNDMKAWAVIDLGAAYKLTDSITVNANINNLLDKDFSAVELFGSGRNTEYAGDYFSTSRSTTGYVNPGRNYWVSMTFNF
ncbi:TonB-dependent receptor [Shewanella avicenniae]|uniref:TonB-dependent receptor n=1 Tax=Shewanella avicenniae TaxID=2814294 RepID=A0ABX7QLT4_9GAMM|nr:TonB-dependent receptor [Shewanella avicenniae]QSX32224.1 TonB-dependent receptor [Shewanella avicenniae]